MIKRLKLSDSLIDLRFMFDRERPSSWENEIWHVIVHQMLRLEYLKITDARSCLVLACCDDFDAI